MASNNGGGNTSSPPAKNHKTASDVPTSIATVAENIDLITLILARLEAKPLMRFKSVSKKWLSLISSPNFSHLHTLQNPNPKPSLILFNPEPEIGYDFLPLGDPSSLRQSPPFESADFSPDVLASCHGLLLCSSFSIECNKNPTLAYVFNPATKKISVIVPPPGCIMLESFRYGLAFDPLRSPHYRVILVRVCHWSESKYEVHIYSSETFSWKKHEREIEWPSYSMFSEGLYSNGAMHWISKSDGSMCFDMDRECTRSMPELPGFPGWPHSMMRYFGKSGGDLHIVDIHGYMIRGIYVFVLERDYSKWSVKYRVEDFSWVEDMSWDEEDMGSLHGLDYHNFTVIGLLQDGEEEEDDGGERIVLHLKSNVISYSFKGKSVKLLKISLTDEYYEKDVDDIHRFDGRLYSETLAWA